VGLLQPLLRLVRARCFASSVVTPRSYKSKWSPLRTLISSHTISHCLLVFFLALEKKRDKTKRYFLGLESDASPLLLSHGKTRFDPNRNRAIGQLALAAPHHASNLRLKGVRCFSC
jgi:hypothetical protein